MIVRFLRLLGIAVLVATTFAGDCDEEGPEEVFGDEDRKADLTVVFTNRASGGDPIHIFDQVLETFGLDNRLSPGGTRNYHYGTVSHEDRLTFAAGRNQVVLGYGDLRNHF